MFNPLKKSLFGTDLRLVSLIATVAVTILVTLLDQTGWAAVIQCPNSGVVCNGTSGDDIMYGNPWSNSNLIHGLGGNDYIIGDIGRFNQLWGDDGNDTLVGGNAGDGLLGGTGSDKYDGRDGDDVIIEDLPLQGTVGTLVNNDDIISGGEGADIIQSGDGFDRIQGGPGNDLIYPDGYSRDFSYDSVNCGSGTDRIPVFYSGDSGTTTNCESVTDYDR